MPFNQHYSKLREVKALEIKSPILVEFDLENGLACKISHQVYSETKSGFKLPVPYSYFVHLTEKNNDGKFILPVDADKLFGKNVISQLTEIKSIMSRCAQFGEILNGKLKTFNDKNKNNSELSDIYKKYDERYEKMDFMSHRNLFRDLIKSKKLANVNSVMSSYNVNSVTATFYQFILDRNKYTHGDLMYWYPYGKTLLDFRNEKGEMVYGEVNQDILNSYISVYNELNKLLDTLDK